VSEQLALLPGYLTAHLQLSLAALAIGAGVSLPLGIWITRRPGLEPGVLGAASVIQTVPSLALLAIMVPLLAGLGALTARFGVQLQGIGYAPALIALSLYSLLPMLRNTVAGIRSVDPALVEAARGVGMTDRQRLLRVELPLGAPVIVAGLRTATVWVVGTATLSTPIGATSLGNFIFSGLATRNDAAVLVGCVAAAGLALLLDGVIRTLEVGVRDRRRGLVAAALATLLGLGAWAGASTLLARAGGGGERAVAIGSKTFTEQYILAELLARQIQERTGAPTRAVPSLGSTVAFDALVAGDIDVYVDYSGTIWATLMKRTGLPERRAEVLAQVEDYLTAEHGLGLAATLGFENTYALAMRADHARRLSLASISDLAREAPRLELGGDYEFFGRAEWRALKRHYGLSFRARRSMDPALMYRALANGEVDVISAFSTDGRLAAFDLFVLEDDRGVIPPYDAIVLVGARLLREQPAVVAALEALDGRIDAASMRRSNLRVDGEGATPARAAEELLARIRGARPPDPERAGPGGAND
jgi:osmoprotectant transport system permease protein